MLIVERIYLWRLRLSKLDEDGMTGNHKRLFGSELSTTIRLTIRVCVPHRWVFLNHTNHNSQSVTFGLTSPNFRFNSFSIGI